MPDKLVVDDILCNSSWVLIRIQLYKMRRYCKTHKTISVFRTGKLNNSKELDPKWIYYGWDSDSVKKAKITKFGFLHYIDLPDPYEILVI